MAWMQLSEESKVHTYPRMRASRERARLTKGKERIARVIDFSRIAIH